MIDLLSEPAAQIAGLLFQYQQTERLSYDQQLLKQRMLIQQLVGHAVKTVPYYRQHPVWSNLPANSRWTDLPILTRQDIQKHQTELISQAQLEGHGRNLEFRSSGSTGRPIHVYSTDYAQIFWRSLTLRDHLWARRNMSQKLATIKSKSVEQARYPGVQQKSWGPAMQEAILPSGPSFFLNSSEPISTQYQWLCEIQPQYVLTYPSSLAELAKLQLKQKRLNSIVSFSTLGETLTPETRALVKQAFSCRIHDIYSAQEIGYMALQCPKYDHYHIMAESCFIEILDDHGEPCQPGQMGKVIVTPLQNYRMPLLRYENGDYAIQGKGCDCGIKLPTIERIVGRTRNLVTYPNGEKRWPTYNPMALMELFPEAQFQITQNSLTSLTLNIAGISAPDFDTKQRAVEIIQSSLDYPFEIDICLVDVIPRANSGKFEEFVSRI